MNGNKILIVVESIDVNDSSGSKTNVALIQSLKKAGYNIVVYHYTRKTIHLDGIPCISINENRRSLYFLLSRFERVLRTKLKVDLHKRLENYFGFSFTLLNDRNSIVKGLKIIGDFTPDLILTLSKGGSFRPHHALLKLPQWHAKWMAYMHDPYPMHHYPKPYTWVEAGHEQKETFIQLVSEKAAFSAFPSQLLLDWMGQFYPNFLKTGMIIPHQIYDQREEKIFPSFFDPNIFTLLHAGNLLGARDPRVLIKAYKKFLKNIPEAGEDSKLMFIGGKDSRVAEQGAGNSNIFESTEYINFDQVFNLQKMAAVNIILEAKSEISPFLPGKFPHCVSADRPILLLGPEKSEARRLLGIKYSYWAEIDDQEKITSIIQALYDQWKNGTENFRLNRPDLVNYLGPNHLQQVIGEILESRS